MARIDELRMMTKVAHMYHVQGLRQTQIVERLHISQSTVSRLLQRAGKAGIVRVIVTAPSGTQPELEEAMQHAFGLKEVVVVETTSDEEQVARDLGAAAAYYLETTLDRDEVIGISAWSSALLSMVNAMHPKNRSSSANVVQILGGVGSPTAEVHATQVTRRLASLVGGAAILLPAPGVVGSAEARRVLLRDPFVKEALALFDNLTLALVGIGSVEPSLGLASSGNSFSAAELENLRGKGAVGDICLRFFDAHGKSVNTPLNDRVIAIELPQLQRVRRIVGVAGGRRKADAIRGALEGRLVNVLITDQHTARRLLKRTMSQTSEPPEDRRRAHPPSTEGDTETGKRSPNLT